MAKNAGQKRQAAQAGLDNEIPKRTSSKASKEVVIPTRTKRTTRSSDQSNSSISGSPENSANGPYAADKESAQETPSVQNTPNKKQKIIKKGIARPVVKAKKAANSKVTKNGSKTSTKAKPTGKADDGRGSSLSEVSIPTKQKNDDDVMDEAAKDDNDDADGPSYWLMKAEPESRIEKGKDVKFSIDDLKNATKPEAWDGVRNATARNNMRTMMKGDMAFFYHSNCKKPGIVGTMEIVGEHSVDVRNLLMWILETAFDPKHPYYDEKSTREKPKWCVVHVEFRRKFPYMVSLKELQKFAKPGGLLENMQTLKMSRLSISKVSKKEWDFIHELLLPEDDDAA
ncbi:MAG: hypothetical protein Q9181_004579 [Wetmoreana brouardii]